MVLGNSYLLKFYGELFIENVFDFTEKQEHSQYVRFSADDKTPNLLITKNGWEVFCQFY